MTDYQTTLTGGVQLDIDGCTISIDFGDFVWRDFVTEEED